MSLTGRHVPLCAPCTGRADHERVPLRPSTGQDARCLPQLQVLTDSRPACQLQQTYLQFSAEWQLALISCFDAY